MNKIDLSPIKLKEKLKELPKLTEVSEIKKPPIDITSFAEKEKEIEVATRKSIPQTKPLAPLRSIEIASTQIKEAVQNFIEKKSKTNKQINSATTIKAIRKCFNLEEGDTKWDEEIWMYAINISKKICVKQTPKTIYFK